jgi:NACalpha-BTF3-like transcription factor
LFCEQPQQPEEKAESESEAEMEEDEEDEIPLDMEDIEAVSKRARQDENLNTEHLQVQLGITVIIFVTW